MATLLSYMLDETEPAIKNSTSAPALTHLVVSMANTDVGPTLQAQDLRTPRFAERPLVPSSTPVTPIPSADDPMDDHFPSEKRPTEASATSSLIHSTTVLIDLIRKNNSDYTEQQILHWLRKQATDPDSTGATFGKTEEVHLDKGPSLVALGPLLTVISARLADFQRLLQRPRSSVSFDGPRRLRRFTSDFNADGSD